MASQVHYEIFHRVGPKTGWTLADICTGRDEAVALARAMMAESHLAGVKVVKETFSEDSGAYLSLKIFEDGPARRARAARAAADPPLPCFRPADLYSRHARDVMARVLADFLARHRITVIELIHRADMLEMLEATGTLYQHAIQKVAVAEAATTGQPVQQIVRKLGDLAIRAIHKVYRDAHEGAFPDLAPQAIAALATKLAGAGDGPYLLHGAIARHLAKATGWDGKLFQLIALMSVAPAEPAGRALLLSAVDAIAAEIVGGPAALPMLLGPAATPADTLARLIELFLGRAAPSSRGLAALAAHFAADDLPQARGAAARRIIAELRANRRFAPDSLEEELKTLRRLADRALAGVGRHLDHDDLMRALILRARRLVTQQALAPYILNAAPDEKISRLLFVEENIIGAENKRQLAGFVLPAVAAPAFERMFHDEAQPVFRRLKRLAELQERVLRSHFPDMQRREIAGQMDRIALGLAERARLFEGLESRPAAERIAMLLKLVEGGVLTEGALCARARSIALAALATPGFLTAYLARRAAEGQAAETAMAILTNGLGRIGITAEAGLKTIAA